MIHAILPLFIQDYADVIFQPSASELNENQFHLYLDRQSKHPSVIEKGFMILENPDVLRIDHRSIYDDLLNKEINKFSMMDFKMIAAGFYDCENGPKQGCEWIGKQGKDYFTDEHRMDLEGIIYNDNQICDFTMQQYDGLKRGFTMEYWTDWKETYSGRANFDINKIYSLLRHCDQYDGIEYSLGYAGKSSSMAPIHFEDDDLMSTNLLMFGIKCWIVINAKECAKLKLVFKTFIDKLNVRCTNYYRHKTMILHPGFLKQHDIKYSVVVQRPGQIFVSNVTTMHQTNCVTKTFAGACNFATKSWINIDNHDRCDCFPIVSYDKKCLQKLQQVIEEKQVAMTCAEYWRYQYDRLYTELEKEGRIVFPGNHQNIDFGCQVQLDTAPEDISDITGTVNNIINSLEDDKLSSQCPHCTFKSLSSQKHSLARHITSKHVKDKIYFQCTIANCGKRYARSDVLRRHMNKMHPTNIPH